jgi:diguanylate cyclase (GGDEF)-like protein
VTPLLKRRALSVLIAAGFGASAVGILGLRSIVQKSGALYSLDTVGSQIESDLEYRTQESRWAFLYALGIHDPNEQLSYFDASSTAEMGIVSEIAQLRALPGANIMEASITRFQSAWESYGALRDATVTLILAGETGKAIKLDKSEGQRSFLVALSELHNLKAALSNHARTQSSGVSSALRGCIAGLTGFAIAATLIILAVVSSNRRGNLILQSPQAMDDDLSIALKLQSLRTEVLRMVGNHQPLGDILAAITGLVPLGQSDAGAAFWTVTDGALKFQTCGSEFPAGFAAVLAEKSWTMSSTEPARDTDCAADLRAETARWNLCAEVRFVRDSQGKLLGVLLTSAAGSLNASARALSDEASLLAAVAAGNSTLHDRLAFDTRHDVLTKLPNRLLFQNRLDEALKAAQTRDRMVTVIWIDLDRYKQVNDTYGHRVGDELLCEVGRRIAACLRDNDTVARLGGDDFAVVVGDVEDCAEAEGTVERILAAIREPMMLLNNPVRISASIGFSCFPEHGRESGLLMRNADLAMCKAKEAGRNISHKFLPCYSESPGRRMQIEQELKWALDRQELELVYHPLMARSGEIDGVECLIRWNATALGRVPPAEFIPVAEETGLIGAIGYWVLHTACMHAQGWQASGIEVPRIAVNVSAVQFMNPGFASDVEQILHQTGFGANRLEIDVNETVLIRDIDLATKQISRLRKVGVRFAVDDFGTGYSSLNRLRTLPVDVVKIDRSFIQELDRKRGNSVSLVRRIIELAHSLDLRVVAEGVETEEQLSLLHSNGCDITQGFYLQKPVSAKNFETMILRGDATLAEPVAAEQVVQTRG